MSEIINFQTPYRFAVYEHKIQSQKELSSIRMIVIRNQSNQVIQYTGLEEFSYPYTGQRPKITVRTKSELVYICEALNYIFANNRVKRIADITADMIFDFFGYYCNTPKGISNDIMLTQQSLDNCVRHVSHFFSNLAATYPTKITPEELLNYVETKANKHSQRIKRRYTPIYNPKRPHSYDVSLLRDMPLAAANRLVELATIYDPMIAFAIVLQLSAGLRPSCICNVRQADSPISTKPGISLTFIGSGISGITIDLTHEYMLRSDGVNVGKIKREREVKVYKPFVPELYTAYQEHMRLLAHTPCEEKYKPMFINSRGKAMTYNDYSRRLKKLVYNRLKPELYYSSDPSLSAFAHLLDSQNWAPHTLRHCFTVRLVKAGLDVAQVQMYRGDSSPESAIAYIGHKSELEGLVNRPHQNTIEDLSAAYERKSIHGGIL